MKQLKVRYPYADTQKETSVSLTRTARYSYRRRGMRMRTLSLLVVTLAMLITSIQPADAFRIRRRPAPAEQVTVLERPADDTIEVHMSKLGFGYTKPEDAEPKASEPENDKIVESDWDFSGLNMLGSNGLIEVTSPHTIGRERLQVGWNFIDRRLGNDGTRITARASFQHLSFGLLDRLEIGFGSTGYYKAASNTTYYNAKFRLTNPLRHRFAMAVGLRSYDFGSGSATNTSHYYGTLGFPLKHGEFFINALNNSNDNFGDLTFSGGLLFNTNYQMIRYPVALMIEGVQDANNSFNKINFGVRWGFTENAMVDLILIRDLTREEFSPSVGGTLTF